MFSPNFLMVLVVCARSVPEEERANVITFNIYTSGTAPVV